MNLYFWNTTLQWQKAHYGVGNETELKFKGGVD
jgi:hypothetical protein